MDVLAFLKSIGEGKTVEEIAEAINKDFLPKNFVPSEKYNNTKSELKTAAAQLEKLNTSVAELTGKVGESEATKAEIAKITAEYQEYKSGEETRLTGLKKQSVLEKALLKHKIDEHSVEDAVRYFDLEKLALKEDGSLDGFDSQLEAVKGKKPNWFAKESVIDPNTPPTSTQVTGGGDWTSKSLKELKADKII